MESEEEGGTECEARERTEEAISATENSETVTETVDRL